MDYYSRFAGVYDALMENADYSARTTYLLRLFNKFGAMPTLLLDAACGTGSFSNLFAKAGIEVIGTDISEDMLCIAREKSAEEGLDVLYLCQDLKNLDLYGTVDGAICCLDSLNHITEHSSLAEALSKISLFLEDGKLFIFDVNTIYKHQAVLGNNTFAFEENGIYCVWQNHYREKNHLVDIELDFFVEEDGVYIRSSEKFSERAYTQDELAELLAKAGFQIEAIYGDMTEKPPADDCERVIYVCRKQGKK